MKSEYKWLTAIFSLTLSVRLIVAFLLHNFTYESYFHLRQVEYITAHGLPLFNGPLSYGGRELIFLPGFHYLAAFFNLFMPLEVLAKILPNLLLSSLVILTFLIAKKVTQNETGSLFSAAIVGFLPILFQTNAFGPESLALPLVFICIYSFLHLKNTFHLYLYIFAFIILSVTSGSAAFLLIVGYGIYLLLSLLESKKSKKEEIEIVIFSLFLFIWRQFIFSKQILIKEGIGFIWQNIPPQILLEYFPKISIIESLVLISIVPLLAGVYVVYRSLFKLKGERSFLLISLVISTLLMAWLRIIELKLALAFLGIILAILFASFYKELVTYLQKTKLTYLKKYLIITLTILLIITMIIPVISTAMNQPLPTDKEIAAFKWLKENTPQDSGVLALLKEGHLVTFYAQRKNLMDDQFDLIKNSEQRFANLNSLFQTTFSTHAISLLDEYKLQYLVLTPTAQKKYNLETFPYLTKECFQQIYNDEVKIYQLICKLEA